MPLKMYHSFMSLKQKLLLSFLFSFINTIRFFELSFNRLLKYSIIAVFSYVIFLFLFNNLVNIKSYLYKDDSKNVVHSINIPTLVENKKELVKVRELPIPEVTSNIFLITNKDNDQVIYEYNSNLKTAPASTAKLMTALVSLDIYDLNEKILVPDFCTNIEATNVGLLSGYNYEVIDLLHALLINSGADAACTLSNAKIPEYEFIELMNSKALDFNMKNTNFTNSIGLDGENGLNYSTATDLYVLSKKATNNEVIKNIVNKDKYIIKAINSDIFHYLNNTNKLLNDIPNSVGVKTGETFAAGEALIYEYHDDISNTNINIIVIQSLNRFYDTKELLMWTLGSFALE